MNNREANATRRLLFLTAQEVANELGVDRRHVQYMETGQRTVMPAYIELLHDCLDLRRQYIDGFRLERGKVQSFAWHSTYNDYFQDTEGSLLDWRAYQSALAHHFTTRNNVTLTAHSAR